MDYPAAGGRPSGGIAGVYEKVGSRISLWGTAFDLAAGIDVIQTSPKSAECRLLTDCVDSGFGFSRVTSCRPRRTGGRDLRSRSEAFDAVLEVTSAVGRVGICSAHQAPSFLHQETHKSALKREAEAHAFRVNVQDGKVILDGNVKV